MGGNERECAAYQSLDTKEFNETQQVEQTQGSFNCPIQEAAL